MVGSPGGHCSQEGRKWLGLTPMREDRCPAAVRGTADQPSRLVDSVAFTKGVPLMRISSIESSVIPPRQGIGVSDTTTVLFDLENDPTQLTPIHDTSVEARLCASADRGVVCGSEGSRKSRSSQS